MSFSFFRHFIGGQGAARNFDHAQIAHRHQIDHFRRRHDRIRRNDVEDVTQARHVGRDGQFDHAQIGRCGERRTPQLDRDNR